MVTPSSSARRSAVMTGAHPERVLTGTADENIAHDEPEARTYSPMNIDASFDITVERTPWGDVTLSLRRYNLQLQLDPAEAARICQEIWTALGHAAQAPGHRPQAGSGQAA